MADRQELHDLVARALAEDLGSGDITSEAVVLPNAAARARVVQKQPGVVFGLEAAGEAFAQAGAASFEGFQAEGEWRDSVPADVALANGPARALLAAERTALNLLCHLSGVATLTARFVDAAGGSGATILDTRKTTPGLRSLEKAAVIAGGGHNHRMGLHDAVLIKENHIALSGGLAEAVRRAREAEPQREIEVECRDAEEVEAALGAGAERLLLDNMTLVELRAAVALRDAAAGTNGPAAALEASGGIGLDNVAEVAATGVDFISVGALTHSAPALDLSMVLEPVGEAAAGEQDQSQRNVEALRPVYEAWGRGDWSAGPEVYGPRMTWGWSDDFPEIHGTYSDPAVALDRARRWLSPWEHWRVVAEEYVPIGERVLVLARYRGRGKGSGAEVDVTGAHLWVMRDGKAESLMVFNDRDKALAAAGLPRR
ncbi:MAG TPA: carboxylating nicotinate-nucleotide diphosphorylase [Solirubrobacterales bacterium]|nr:carboxylating nicotinate-nucleotide diphosphorylase [Solirubrobacterales bacterium]